jgi:hypothetical protein
LAAKRLDHLFDSIALASGLGYFGVVLKINLS